MDRTKGIGGSDAPVVLGQSPFKTRQRLWAEKTGLVEPEDISDRENVYWGKKLEGMVADEYLERAGISKVLVDRSDEEVTSDKHPFMLCHPDRVVEHPDRGPGVVEVKTTSAFALADWQEGAPLMYQIQLMHNLAVCAERFGTKWGAIPVLIGGQKFRFVEMEINLKFVRALVRKEEEFWDLVQTKTPPELADGELVDKAVLAAMYPKETEGEAATLPEEFSLIDERLRVIDEQSKALEDEREELRGKLMAAIGDAQYGVIPGVPGRWQWKLTNRKGYTREVAPWSGRILRRVK